MIDTVEHPPRAGGLWGTADAILRPVELAAALIGAAATVLAMLLVSADALMRYLVNSPIKWQYHLTENYVMVALVTMPLAWSFRTGGYIRIEGFAQRLPSAGARLLIRAGLLVSAVYVAVLAWVSWVHFLEVYHAGEVEFGVLDWPVAWSWVWVPVGLGLLALRLLLSTFGPDSQLRDTHDATEESL